MINPAILVQKLESERLDEKPFSKQTVEAPETLGCSHTDSESCPWTLIETIHLLRVYLDFLASYSGFPGVFMGQPFDSCSAVYVGKTFCLRSGTGMDYRLKI